MQNLNLSTDEKIWRLVSGPIDAGTVRNSNPDKGSAVVAVSSVCWMRPSA